jgi:hypothetical protein
MAHGAVIWALMDLGSPTLMALLFAAQMPYSWLVLLTACSIPWQMASILGIFNFLGSPLLVWIHPHSFTHYHLMGCLQVFWSCHTLLSHPGLLLKSVWKPPWPHSSYIMYLYKTSIMTPRSQHSSNRRDHLNYGCRGLWVPGWLNWGKHLHRQLCGSKAC